MFGKVHWFCPNCGAKHYDNKLAISVKSQAAQCSKKCLDEWEIKTVRYIMGKDEEQVNVSK